MWRDGHDRSTLMCLFLVIVLILQEIRANSLADGGEGSVESTRNKEKQWMFQSEEKWDAQWRAGQWGYMDTVAIERAKVSVVGVLSQMYAPPPTATPTSDTAPTTTLSSTSTRFTTSVGTVLDVGCGEGSLADFLPPHMRIGYVGIDLSKEAVLSAKRKRPSLRFIHSAAHHFHLNLAGGDGDGGGGERGGITLPGPVGQTRLFDVVNFADMLYYVDYSKILRQYEHFLSPDGIVIISIFFQDKGKLLYDNIFQDARKVYDKIDAMEISGTTRKQAHGKAIVEVETAFHIEVYRKKNNA